MNKNSGTTNLVRPSFGPGMLLQHQDLELLGSYTRDLSRLLFRSFFGCGVVCGLVVTAKTECDKLKIIVEPGVALNCTGDPIWVSDRLEFFAEKSDTDRSLWVVVCSHTKHFGPRAPMCETDGESSGGACTREVDCYKVMIKDDIEGYCGCPEQQTATGTSSVARGEGNLDENDCYKDHKEGKCGCACADCGDCVVLAKLVYRENTPQGQDKWMANHSARRFIRPALLPDLQAAADKRVLNPPAASLAQSPGPPPAAEPTHQQAPAQPDIKFDQASVAQKPAVVLNQAPAAKVVVAEAPVTAPVKAKAVPATEAIVAEAPVPAVEAKAVPAAEASVAEAPAAAVEAKTVTAPKAAVKAKAAKVKADKTADKPSA